MHKQPMANPILNKCNGMAIRCNRYLFFNDYSPSSSPSHRFNIYILDYCLKRGYIDTAKQLRIDAALPEEEKPPIDAKQGLLFE